MTCTTAIVVFPITLRANPRPPALLHRPPLAPPPSPYSLSYLCVGLPCGTPCGRRGRWPCCRRRRRVL
ncbi:hypothetical protein V6N13_010641 [Hibiscus sabdariffa]